MRHNQSAHKQIPFRDILPLLSVLPTDMHRRKYPFVFLQEVYSRQWCCYIQKPRPKVRLFLDKPRLQKRNKPEKPPQRRQFSEDFPLI